MGGNQGRAASARGQGGNGDAGSMPGKGRIGFGNEKSRKLVKVCGFLAN